MLKSKWPGGLYNKPTNQWKSLSATERLSTSPVKHSGASLCWNTPAVATRWRCGYVGVCVGPSARCRVRTCEAATPLPAAVSSESERLRATSSTAPRFAVGLAASMGCGGPCLTDATLPIPPVMPTTAHGVSACAIGGASRSRRSWRILAGKSRAGSLWIALTPLATTNPATCGWRLPYSRRGTSARHGASPGRVARSPFQSGLKSPASKLPPSRSVLNTGGHPKKRLPFPLTSGQTRRFDTSARPPIGHFETAANTALNLELSGAVSVDGGFTYTVVS